MLPLEIVTYKAASPPGPGSATDLVAPASLCGLGDLPVQMNYRHPSRLRKWALLACAFCVSLFASAQTVHLSEAEAQRIGHRLWENECGGTIAGLTSWNSGEDFASLGIGHFIWYPQGETGPFEESFPPLVSYLKTSGVRLPEWLTESHGCPWPNRSAFLADLHGPRLAELRKILSETVPFQARFAAHRLETALPKMLAAASPDQQERVRRNFYRVASTSGGMYALMDYVNFKGEGTSPTERYQGEGWGLLQVLAAMNDGSPLEQFSVAADRVLTRRVRLAPPERHEERWLPGWRSRVRSYARS